MKHTLKFARIGSISYGTMNPDDLIPCFAQELDVQIQRNLAYMQAEEAEVLGRMQEILASADAPSESTLDELFDALNHFAPPFTSFCAHQGDGADFGFWTDVDLAREDCEFVSSDKQEFPDDDFVGCWLHVSDHGNATLYERSGGEDVEVWSVV